MKNIVPGTRGNIAKSAERNEGLLMIAIDTRFPKTELEKDFAELLKNIQDTSVVRESDKLITDIFIGHYYNRLKAGKRSKTSQQDSVESVYDIVAKEFEQLGHDVSSVAVEKAVRRTLPKMPDKIKGLPELKKLLSGGLKKTP